MSITHSHSIYKCEDEWCKYAGIYMQKAKLDGADGEAKGLCTLVGLSLFRRPDLLAFAADSAPGTGIGSGAFGSPRYTYDYQSHAHFCDAWAEKIGRENQLAKIHLLLVVMDENGDERRIESSSEFPRKIQRCSIPVRQHM